MTFYDGSTDPDLAVEAAVLTEVVRAAADLGLEVLVIGAVARDILIRGLLGARPERATKDVDVAVAVADWSAYDRLTSSLPRSGGPSHRFVVHGFDVDIIPFGGIESPRRTITWPDQKAMDVHGFAEAHRRAVAVKLPGGLEVRVASLAAQSALKILAWRDRRHEDDKDAIDLRTILAAASQGSNLEELLSTIPTSSSASITTRSSPGPPGSAPTPPHCSTRTARRSWLASSHTTTSSKPSPRAWGGTRESTPNCSTPVSSALGVRNTVSSR